MSPDPEIVRFLVASDIHAGYAENKQYIGNDSFETLREVLTKAKDSKVDFVLLGGDLFHENHPTRETQLKVVRLLRKFCVLDEKPDLEFVSDPTINFQHSNFPSVNYLDENLHISMPIFTIHGNHDDLSGRGLSALDVLHETGHLNLFGKFSDVDHIEVTPILLRRANTKIAIYGIGSQRDDRLARAFYKGRIKFKRPEDEDPDSWFNILVLHQNRPPRSKLRSTKSHLSFKCIPLFFDLVIWGHEHECLIEPDFKHMDVNDQSRGFYIIQPGSTVATALSTEEAEKKHIGILSVKGKQFKLKKIELQTTRQIIIDELVLDEVEPTTKIARTTIRQKNMKDEQLIDQRLNQLLDAAEAEREPTRPYPPRVRLKVVYSGRWLNIPPINGRKFGVKYMERVANAAEMIFVRVKRDEKRAFNVGDSSLQIFGARNDDVFTVDEMVAKYFGTCDFKHRLNVLSEINMGKQLQEYSNTELNTQFKYNYADRSLGESIKEQINEYTNKVKELVKSRVDENESNDVPLLQQITECLLLAKKERLGRTTEEGSSEANSALNDTADTSFHERGFDPSNMITSTPRPSQEREVRWLQAVAAEEVDLVTHDDVDMVELDVDIEGGTEVSDRDFSP